MDTATSEIYSLSLHDALPIYLHAYQLQGFFDIPVDHLFAAPVLINYFLESGITAKPDDLVIVSPDEGSIKRALVFKERSEEHTSELQSHSDLVCRLLLEKKKK